MFAKADCHLCEMVEEEIRAMPEAVSKLTVVDITSDRSLQDRYLLRIPVVVVGGREIFEAKMMDTGGKWKKMLASMLDHE